MNASAWSPILSETSLLMLLVMSSPNLAFVSTFDLKFLTYGLKKRPQISKKCSKSHGCTLDLWFSQKALQKRDDSMLMG